MTIIRPNSISGVSSITAQGGDITYFKSDGTAGNQFTHNIQSTGVVTATKFDGPFDSLTVSGNLSIGGTITYEDVTNVDSIGVITARSGIKIGPTAGVAATIFADGSINSTGIITATTFHGSGANLTGITGGGGGYKNLIINGGALVAQRKPSGEIQFSGYGSVDRFQNIYSGTDEAPNQLQSDIGASDSGENPYKAGMTKAFHIRNGNQTSVGSNDTLIILYRVEAQDLRNSGWDYTNPNSYVTFSYYVKSSIAQNFYVTFKTNDGTPQKYAMETGALSAQVWKRVTHTIPGNSNLQFDANADEGLEIEWSIFRGTDQTGSMSLNSWAAHNNSVRTPDQTSTWYDANNATFEITGVQLEVGSSATAFENRTFADELLRCQRYCFRLGGAIGGEAEQYTTLAMGVQSHSTTCKTHIQYPVTMRSKDVTFTVSNLTVDDDVDSYVGGRVQSVGSDSSSATSATLNLSTSSMGTVRATRILVSTSGGYIQGECEL